MLLQSGHEVRGLVRPDDDRRRLELPPHNLCVGDIQDAECVRHAMDGIDIVVHSAALLPDASHAARDAFHEVNVDGTRNVMCAAIAYQTKWVIAMSTISVVDHVTRTVGPADLRHYVTETNDPYLTSKIAAERLLFDMRQRYEGQLAILRLAYVYGPGNFAVWRRPLRFLEEGKLRLINNGSAAFPLIHADDIGKFVLALLGTPALAGHDGIHILANPQHTTLRAIFDFIAEVLRLRPPGSVPLWLARAAAVMASTVPKRFRSGRLEMLTHARVQQFSRGYDLSAVLDQKTLAALDMTDYRQGLLQMLADYVALERNMTKS
jgi:nucleoside-diphosphate-sugar epimerase